MYMYARDGRIKFKLIYCCQTPQRRSGVFKSNLADILCENYYFDTVLAMGQRNAAMACARTTDAVMHMHHDDGYAGVNYLDDLIGVCSPDVGWDAYNSLGQLLHDLGLLENLSKACPPATVQLVLGVLVNTIDGTVSVPADRLEEIVVVKACTFNKF